MALNTRDKSASGNNLTNSGGAEILVSLPFADSTGAVDLTSSSGAYLFVVDANQTGLDFTTTFTVEGWVNFRSLPSINNVTAILAKDINGTSRAYAMFFRNAAGTYRIEMAAIDSGGLQDYYSWAWTPVTGTWYHIAITCNTANASASTFEFFLNGVSQGNGTAQGADNIASINNSTVPFSLGAYSDGTISFDGKLDDWRAWNTVRTGTQITNNKSLILAGSDSGLVGYWTFDPLGGGLLMGGEI